MHKLIQMKQNDDKLPAENKKIQRLKNIVSFERIEDSSLYEVASMAGLKLMTLGDVIQAGIQAQETIGGYRPKDAGANDPFMLCYTSGTTGDPKGVIMTHKMMMNCVGAHHYREEWRAGESYMSYLPLAHAYEQFLFTAATTFNIKIGFYSGDVLKLVSEDIPTLKPNIFPSVPRIYNRIFGKIKEGIES